MHLLSTELTNSSKQKDDRNHSFLDWRKQHHTSHCPSKHKSHLVLHILLYIQLCDVLPLAPTVQQMTEEALQDFGHFPTLLSGHKSKIHTTLNIYSGEVPLFGISIDIILSKNYPVCKQPDLSSTLNVHYLTDLHINKPSGNSPAFWCTHYILLFIGSRGLWQTSNWGCMTKQQSSGINLESGK